MGNTLVQGQAGAGLAGEVAESEWEGDVRVSLDHKLGRGLELGAVVGGAADVDGGALGALLGLAGAGRHEDVDGPDLVDPDGALAVGCSVGGVEDDALVALDAEARDVVGKHVLDRLAVVCLGNLLNRLGHLRVLVVGLGKTKSNLKCVVGSENNIGLASGHDVLLAGSNNMRAGSEARVAVDVDTKITVKERRSGFAEMHVVESGRDQCHRSSIRVVSMTIVNTL